MLSMFQYYSGTEKCFGLFQVGVDGVQSQSLSHVMKWGLRIMPVIMVPFMASFPAVSKYFDKRI